MKRLLISILLVTGLSAAQNGIYVELNAGIVLKDEKKIVNDVYTYDENFVGSVAVGYQMDLLRFEIEESYNSASVNSVNLNSASGTILRESKMFNLYYSGYNDSKLVSTIGIGAGVSDVKSKDLKILGASSEFSYKNVFSYQASFGVAYMLDEDWSLNLKYKYLATMKKEQLQDYSDSIVTLGIRYLF